MSTDLAARLQSFRRAQTRRQRITVPVPPFTCYFTQDDPPNGAAYLDLSEIDDLGDALARLKIAFAKRASTLRICWLEAFSPHLGEQLQLAGLVESEQWPIQICTPEDLDPPQLLPTLEIVTVTYESPLATIQEGWNTNAWGYDLQAAPATETQVEEFRRGLSNNCAFTARLNGKPVAAGMFDVIRDGITELVGITTLAPFRGRGIATYLSAHITRAAFARGAHLVFLIPENDTADRVYHRIGYRPFTVERVYCTEIPAKESQ